MIGGGGAIFMPLNCASKSAKMDDDGAGVLVESEESVETVSSEDRGETPNMSLEKNRSAEGCGGEGWKTGDK